MHTRWISLRPGSCLLLLALLTGLVACGNSAATPAAAPTKALSGAATATATAAPTAIAAPTITPTVASTPTAVPTPTATIAPSPSPTPIPPTASPTLTPRPSATATRPVAAPSSPALRPNGPIPAGWKSFSGKEKPVAIAYPPDWSVEEDQDSISFVHPNGVTGMLISALGERAATLGLEQLREQYFTAVTAGCEKTKPQLGEEEQIYGGVVFISMGSECSMPDGARWFYIAVGIDRGRAWGILTVEKVAQVYASIDAYFDPMLASLNFGGQAVASPSPAPTPSPTATRPPAGGTPGAGLQPHGPIPAGWRVYSGKTMPFAIAYPPDWQIQTAYEGLGYVNFVAPDGITTVQIKQAGDLTASLGIDRLRELYMEELGKQCGAAARSAGYNVFAGVRFAALRIDCTASGKTIDLYYGTGITNGEEWNISLIAPTGAWEAAAQQFFGPIVDTLTLQGQP